MKKLFIVLLMSAMYLTSSAQCTQGAHTQNYLRLTGDQVQITEKSTDQALSRRLLLTKSLNGNMISQSVSDYTTNDLAVTLDCNFDYTISTQMVCLNGDTSSWSYNADYHFSSYQEPQSSAMSINVTPNSATVSIPIPAVSMVSFKYKKTSARDYTITPFKLSAPFTVSNLSPGTMYDVLVSYVKRDGTDVSAYTFLNFSTNSYPALTPFVFSHDSQGDWVSFNNLSTSCFANPLLITKANFSFYRYPMIAIGANRLFLGGLPSGTYTVTLTTSVGQTQAGAYTK